MEPIQLTEYGETPLYAAADLADASGLDPEQLRLALQPLVELGPTWTPGQLRLRAGSSVGTVKVGTLRIDVRPRIAASDLVTLIRYALGGPVRSWQRSAIADERVGLE